MKKVKGLSKKNPNKPYGHGQQYGDNQREKWVGEEEEGKREINGDGRGVSFGW